MKRAVFSALVLVGLWFFLTGMGMGPDGEVPTPESSFSGLVTDDQGITTRCDNISWEGEVYFKGRRGRALITVPFEKVKKVVFVATSSEGMVDFRVTLETGETVAITFDEDARLFGTTSFGTYKIFARDIKEIVFDQKAQ